MSFPIFITYLSFKKSEFKRQLSFSNLSEIKLLTLNAKELYQDKNGISWHEEGKEIEIAGEFYEVIAVQLTGNSVIVQIIKDEAESKLFQSFIIGSKDKVDFLLSLFKMFCNFNFFNADNTDQFYSLQSPIQYFKTAFSILTGFHSNLLRPPSL